MKRPKTDSIISLEISKKLEKARFKSSVTGLIIKVITIVAFFAVAFTFVFGISQQNGEDMYPRMRDGDIILYFRYSSSLENGDIVTLRKDGERHCGRIVAVAGDTVDFSDEGKLLINGAMQYEEIFYGTYSQDSAITFPYKVPKDSVFILGDMRTGSVDSRDFGAVKKSELDGKIISILRRHGL